MLIQEQALGPDHRDVAPSLNTLALIYRDQGLYEQALPLARRALAIRERVQGPAHPETAESLNTLMLLYETQGLDAEALPLAQRTLTILKRRLPDHPATAAAQEHLAALLRRTESVKETSV